MTRTQRDQAVADGLLALSDRLSEALANSEGDHGEKAQTGDLLEINSLVWDLRWQLGLFAGKKELPELAVDAQPQAAQ